MQDAKSRERKLFLLRIYPWVVCICLWVLATIFISGSANKLELTYYDFLSSKTPYKIKNDKVVIVGVDQESLDNIGSWPWLRRYHGYLLDYIGEADAIGIDILFSESDYVDPESDRSFAQALEDNGKVTLPYIYARHSNVMYEPIVPAFRANATSTGYVNFFIDNDSVVRRFYFINGRPFSSTKVKSFPEAVLESKYKEKIRAQKKNLVQQFFMGLGEVKEQMILYSNDPNTFPIFSYDQILKGEIDPSYFKEKIVLVGSTAASLKDRHLTPSLAYEGDLAGVLVLANVVNDMINNQLILVPSQTGQILVGLGLFGLLALISAMFKNENYFLYYILYSAFLLLLSALLLYYALVWLPLVSLSFAILGIGIGRAFIQRSRFRFMAYTDALTGLANRHAFELRFARILDEAYKKKTSTAFILVDVDYFKKYNDAYGHDAGDIVLEKIGQVLSEHTKKGNIAARLGGEEFVLLIPNCQEYEALQRAEAVRQSIIDLDIEHRDSTIKKVSASFGVSVDVDGSAHLNNKIHYQEADIALYEVKSEGRNNVKVRSFIYSGS